MRRGGFLALILVLAWGLPGQTPDAMVKSYWAETVRRGLPVRALSDDKQAVPFWPRLESELLARRSLSPQDSDLALVEGWMLLQQDRVKEASGVLEALWAGPGSGGLSPLLKGEAWFTTLDRLQQFDKLTAAWEAWEPKYLSPVVLLAGLDGLEKSKPPTVTGVLKQALQLYPQDRRWLPWLALHNADFPQTLALLQRDRAQGLGFSPAQLLFLSRKNSLVGELLLKAGYTRTSLDDASKNDYGAFVSRWKPGTKADGVYSWDQDRDGSQDHRIVFRNGDLASWSRGSLDPEGEFSLVTFEKNSPVQITETRRDARWTLDYEAYPYIRALTYSYADHEIEYDFQPFVTALPLGPDGRTTGDPALLPWQMDQDWKPLSLTPLVLEAVTVVTRQSGREQKSLSLASGQVWLSVEDTNADGKPDVWSFFRQGKLDKVYRNPSGEGAATLQEIYSAGDYQAFLADPDRAGKTTFALFPGANAPQEDVQLWDPQGTGKPLIRLLTWDNDQLQVLAFSGSQLPWTTMPVWEPKP